MTNQTPKLRGWAYMQKHNPERFAELTRKGGASLPSEKRSFSTNTKLAAEAGRKGGLASSKARQESRA